MTKRDRQALVVQWLAAFLFVAFLVLYYLWSADHATVNPHLYHAPMPHWRTWNPHAHD